MFPLKNLVDKLGNKKSKKFCFFLIKSAYIKIKQKERKKEKNYSNNYCINATTRKNNWVLYAPKQNQVNLGCLQFEFCRLHSWLILSRIKQFGLVCVCIMLLYSKVAN